MAIRTFRNKNVVHRPKQQQRNPFSPTSTVPYVRSQPSTQHHITNDVTKPRGAAQQTYLYSKIDARLGIAAVIEPCMHRCRGIRRVGDTVRVQ